MASTVEICNGGLQLLGSSLIVSLTDATKAARECNLAWDRVRRMVLRSHAWNCTTTRISLAKLATTPVYGFDFEYQLPTDCLILYDIENSDNRTDWRVEGRKLLTDFDTPLGILYGRDETDSQQFDSLLVEVLALAMAVDLCETLTQSNSKKKVLEQQLLAVRSKALETDGWEQTPAEFEEDVWLLARWRR